MREPSKPQTAAAGARARREARAGGGVLPEGALEATRRVTHALSRLVWRIRYAGLEHIPQQDESGGLIVAANHQTYVDPFWVSVPVRRPLRFLAWDGAFTWPLAGRAMRMLGAWPLQVEGGGDAAAIRRALQWLRGGGALVIFPEGGRAEADGALARFKNGAARMALEAGVPILPVTIRGGQRVWPRGQRLPRPARVEVIYHPPCRVTPRPGEGARACARRATDELAKVIGSAL